MLCKKLILCLVRHSGMFSPFLLVAGLLLMLLLPMYASKDIFLDENNIKTVQPPAYFNKYIIATASSEIQWNQRLVRGLRSPGPDVIAVYVNSAYSESVKLGNIIIQHLLDRNDLSCDVWFYFVNVSVKWPIPETYVKAALVLNFSSLQNPVECVDIYSKHGLRPNQDLANLAILWADWNSFRVSLICQTGRSPEFAEYGPLVYYIKSLEESMLVDNYPQPWHAISTRGIHTIALSSNPAYAYYDEDKVEQNSNVTLRYVTMTLQILLSISILDEKLHHATFGYIPTRFDRYVSFDIAQLVIFLFIASITSTAYRMHQLSNHNHYHFGMFLTLAMTPIAAAMYKYAGLPALAMATIFFAEAMKRMPVMLAWISANIVGLVLMIGLQPSTGILGGAAVALQLFFLHPMCSNFILLPGVVISWVAYLYFTWYLGFPIWSTKTISSIFVSVFLYPNAVWVSSRFLRFLNAKEKRNGKS
ncbi:unnamed protein product [Phytomonas sp. EM1]|nr:unnamed protein product [Phytomonas sp. EM1]|eukprot:CCW62902.1 unnamed protein product [Phytomonas sp. isolate EM1]